MPSLPPTSTRLGARLWVSLFAIEAEWLHGESIEYDLQLDTPAGVKSLADLVPGGLHLTGAALPSFMVPSVAPPLRVLHGSCRKPHGKGPEATHRWLEQLDATACLPIRVGQEREALAWLTRHADGDLGLDAASGGVAELLADLDRRRVAEGEVEADGGADWVTVDSTTGAPSEPRRPEAVYPLVGDFEVVVPTEGFVFERLRTVPWRFADRYRLPSRRAMRLRMRSASLALGKAFT